MMENINAEHYKSMHIFYKEAPLNINKTVVDSILDTFLNLHAYLNNHFNDRTKLLVPGREGRYIHTPVRELADVEREGPLAFNPKLRTSVALKRPSQSHATCRSY